MKPRKAPATEEELVNAFIDLFNEVEPETNDEINAVLRQAGHDPEEITIRMKQIADRAIERSPWNWRNQVPAEIEIEKSRLAAFLPNVNMRREDIIDAIRNKLAELSGRTNQLGFAHRNFETASDDDLRSVLSELEYLESNRQTGKSGDEE